MSVSVVTLERVEKAFHDLNLRTEVKNRTVISETVNASFHCSVINNPYLLRISGSWRGRTRAHQYAAEMGDFSDRVNAQSFIPRMFLEVVDEHFRIGYDFSTPISVGMSDEQLHNVLAVMIETVSMYADELDALFPRLVTWDSGTGYGDD